MFLSLCENNIRGTCRERRGFPRDSVVKTSPAVRETQARSLGQEDPLEEVMATHSSILAWEIPWTEEPGGLHTKELDMTETAERSHIHAGRGDQRPGLGSDKMATMP